ncbi:MAG TPA: 23S rRNA (uracil(1939)-C(5))-methyltransferase RlmD [Candidatus Obscuribacterales bacterium]
MSSPVENSTKADQLLRKGQVLRARIASLAPGGDGVCRDYGPPVFVSRVAPGDLVEIELFDVRKDFARGRVLSVVEPSCQRTEPPCKLFKLCGGCHWQHIDYRWQLQAKEEVVRQTVRHIAGLDPDLVLPALAASEPLYYRNKVQFPVKHPHGSRRILAGYYKQGSHELVNIKHCPVQPEPLDRVLCAAKAVLERHAIAAYDERAGRGLLRHIAARYSFHYRQALVTLVVNAYPPGWLEGGASRTDSSAGAESDDDPLALPLSGGRRDGSLAGRKVARDPRARGEALVEMLKPAALELMAEVPEIAGVCLNFNPQAGNRILGETTVCLAGQDHIVEKVFSTAPGIPRRLREGLEFRLSSMSFFQVNSSQIAPLLEEVTAAVGQANGLVVDAYAGVGTIALWLAPACRQVIAIEEHAGAVKDGLANRVLNRINNVDFRQGRVEAVLPALVAEGLKPDAVVLDPPRKGVSPEALAQVVVLAPRRLVYVSCNPATLARDLKILATNGYKTRKIRPIDMFPQTYHVESVAVVEREDE